MNERTAISFFVSQSIKQARALSIHEALSFLQGLLLVADLHEELNPLRDVYSDLLAIDQQLNAMQMQLSLPEVAS